MTTKARWTVMCAAAWTAVGGAIAPVAAQAPPSYNFQFSTIGAPGNSAYNGPDPFGVATGRGSVGYEYRIGTLEVTTSQWMEFVNTYSTQGANHSFVFGPVFWGAVHDPAYSGPGFRWKLRENIPNAGLLPVGGLTWREAALFCNWLHNDKSPSPSAIQNGAYDANTFTNNANGTWNDQLTHHPEAKFWIPTFDEWLKAGHYDPDRFGPGLGGYWQYPHGSDDPPIPGPPGVGQTSAGYANPVVFLGEWDIPLGSYPATLTPWGLLDATGGATEWTEGDLYGEHRWRILDGSSAGVLGSPGLDQVTWIASDHPMFAGSEWGLRIASAVPAPGVIAVVALLIVRERFGRRRSR